ncbi:hypothetical protein H8B09_00900 [Paenibacillus sp. PR3]|uniref:Uncharacterized protein n=1 Tax=Paenibacillus terricola TaxID=2763503 RepID=A0ABR8MPQ7_9BACL|nr:hypothetical protein [Paenibacillus terricola]MBD3917296.1 hypothetical protein [Paenibacillus terricola]
MSEFSQSYHLLGSVEEAIGLINRAGEEGFVFEKANQWTTFVILGDQFVPSDAITESNQGLLVHYVYAEDHGWNMSIFKQSELVFKFDCSWDNMEDFGLTEEELAEMYDSGQLRAPADEIFDLKVVRKLVEEAGNEAADLESLFTKDEEVIFAMETPSAYQIAEKLGISNYAWISADSIDVNDEFYKNVIKV